MITKTKTKKSKKSTNKKKEFQISPIIPIIAIIEVLVLIGVSSYAWYFAQASKVIGSGTISVDADSGLDIDFQYSNVDDYINIWNYVGQDFKFEPATSMDGRMIYFPTSGTFNKTDTKDIVLRDGTVNDINSKYLSIDFELTNTSEYTQYVYLNNNSYFRVYDSEAAKATYQESRALRLAFYSNDGASGNVGSSLLSASGASDGDVITTTTSADSFTIYFEKPTTWGDSDEVYAHLYKYVDGGSGDIPLKDWPGLKMDRVTGRIYSVTFDNPVVNGSLTYDALIFNNNNDKRYPEYNSDPSARKITLTANMNNHKFNSSGDQGVYQVNTVYFLKPSGWGNDVYCHAWTGTGSSTSAYTTEPGDKMTYVGSGIYSYSYDSSNTGGILFDDGTLSGNHQTVDITISNDSSSQNYANDKLYYCNGSYENSKHKVSKYETSYSQMQYKTVYLYNTYDWEQPYANLLIGNSDSTVSKTSIAMVSLSANMYYCTVPAIYDHIYFKASDNNNYDHRTVICGCGSQDNQKVYRPNEHLQTTGQFYGYEVNTFYYSSYISYGNDGNSEGFPVISPGVSVGFQRPYSPVVIINADTGAAEQVIPAYSCSIDDYILGSGKCLFELEPNHMISLSMIMWLEGTDEACTGNAYPGNYIDLKLEFSTVYYTGGANPQDPTVEHIVNEGDSASYTYVFLDKTRELWTSDRQPTASGVTVAPVMQLYDNTNKRGYRMSADGSETHNGKLKVNKWTVKAPQSIVTHDLVFRRVNPYNEDEVWNYWHAGPVAGNGTYDADGNYTATNNDATLYSVAHPGQNNTDTIYFTAFADGSPLSSMSGVGSNANVPPVSCGGLWGNHTVRTVTLYDGIIGQPLGHDGNGVMTVNYTYPYKVGNDTIREVTIEYKASTGDSGFYYFIMPEVAYANKLDCTFKEYRGFNPGYAINSVKKNPNITFVRSYSGTNNDPCKVIGDYVEINEKTDNSHTRFCYWGSDMLYVQTTGSTKDLLFTSSSNDQGTKYLFQVEFSVSGNSKRYSYLYNNSAFNPSDGATGFACVVPNDTDYNQLKLMRCKYDGTQLNMTSAYSLTRVSSDPSYSDPYTGDSNSVKIIHMNGKGLKADHIGTKITMRTNSNDWGGNMYLWAWNSSTNASITSSFPGSYMYPDGASGGLTYYHYDDLNICSFDYVQFVYNVSDNNQQGTAKSFNFNININDLYTNMIYQAQNSTGGGYMQSDSQATGRETIKLGDDWNVPSWPHLTLQ